MTDIMKELLIPEAPEYEISYVADITGVPVADLKDKIIERKLEAEYRNGRYYIPADEFARLIGE